MNAEQGPDERRIAHELRRLGVGPDAVPGPAAPPRPDHAPTVGAGPAAGADWVDEVLARSRATRTPRPTPAPVTPTRVIPAGDPLPARPPGPDELPPWRTPPAPPAPPAGGPPAQPPAGLPPVWHGPGPYGPPASPLDIRITLVPAEPEPEPTWRERLTAWLRTYASPYQAVLGLVLAVAPVPGLGYSAAAIWYTTIAEARDVGSGWGYVIGGSALVLTATALARRRSLTGGKANSLLRIFFFATAFVGAFGAISLYDPVTWITGVTP